MATGPGLHPSAWEKGREGSMKKDLVRVCCHIRPRFLSHKTGTATKLQQELTIESENLKHMDGKSCPVILLIEQCRDASFWSRPAEGKEEVGRHGREA